MGNSLFKVPDMNSLSARKPASKRSRFSATTALVDTTEPWLCLTRARACMLQHTQHLLPGFSRFHKLGAAIISGAN
eukprot:1133586-Amphidinium_carterae.2